MSEQFDRVVAITLAHEGGALDLDPHDRGNWTGAQVGVGELRGSRWGFSAATWPTLDIANLTREGAVALYRAHYYDTVHGDELPAPLALLAFDVAVNSGVGIAVVWLQQAIGATPDGVIGPHTLAAAHAVTDMDAAIVEMMARRIVFDADCAIWQHDALGLARRLAALPLQAKALAAAMAAPAA